MIVCPRCAEDLADATETCTGCGMPVPDWVHRLPLSAPRADRFHALLDAVFFRACQLGLIALAFAMFTFLAIFGHRR